eukprot:8159179-Pyramimonas_sp.AAC.1
MIRAKGLARENMPDCFVHVKHVCDRILGGAEGDVAAGLAHECPACSFDVRLQTLTVDAALHHLRGHP